MPFHISIATCVVTFFFFLASEASILSTKITEANLRKTSSRVINGIPVTDKMEYPFIVDLSHHDLAISTSRFCTGTLIASNIVLTAAHCVLNTGYGSPVFATVGRIELEDSHSENFNSKTFRTIASIAHPDYQGLGSPNDIALVLLNDSSSAPKVSLAESTPQSDQVAWVVGFGIQMLGTIEKTARPIEVLSARLQKTALRIKDRSFCDGAGGSWSTALGMLCTTGVKEGSSACRGDSGGGLFIMKAKQNSSNSVSETSQVGIVSYGDSQCASKESGVFTDVSSNLQWIKKSIRKLHAAFQSKKRVQSIS